MKKGTTGNHYKPERKTAGLSLRLSEADLSMIRGKAEAAGLSVTEFILQACAARRVPGYKPPKAAKPAAGGDTVPGQMDLASFLDDQTADA